MAAFVFQTEIDDVIKKKGDSKEMESLHATELVANMIQPLAAVMMNGDVINYEEMESSQGPPEEGGSQTEKNLIDSQILGEEISDAGADLEAQGSGKARLKRYYPTRADRQSKRLQKGAPSRGKGGQTLYGMEQNFMAGNNPIDNNPFTILNLLEDDDLNSLVNDCDIVLGNSNEEIEDSINGMILEEQIRAAVAEANYKANLLNNLLCSNLLEHENLELGKIDNGVRKFDYKHRGDERPQLHMQSIQEKGTFNTAENDKDKAADKGSESNLNKGNKINLNKGGLSAEGSN